MLALADLIARVAADLDDLNHLIWSVGDHTAHLRRALARYGILDPLRAVTVLDSVAGQREYDIAPLGALDVLDLWYPYNPDAPGREPQRARFWLMDRDTLYLDTPEPPRGTPATRTRLFYLCPHTIAGLDGAEATTLDAAGVELMVLLATASAAMQRCQAAIGKVNVSGWTPQQLLAWANARQALADRAWDAMRHRRISSGDARVSWDLL